MNPGSIEAQEAGCRCPRMDNCYGKGMYGTGQQFVISGDCPIHGLDQAIKALRDAGGDAWDGVGDVQKELAELRGEVSTTSQANNEGKR